MGAFRAWVGIVSLWGGLCGARGEPSPQERVGTSALPHRRVPVAGTDATADVVDVDLHDFRLFPAVASERGASRSTVATLRRQYDAALVVNGTFFDPQGKPLGLLRDGSTRHTPLRKADWGVFEVSESRGARLVHTRDYEARADVDFAIQCGPRAVIHGKVPSLKAQGARRTALCVVDPWNVRVIVVDSVVEASDFATWMQRSEGQGGLGCRDALLLDGGPSSQLSARLPSGAQIEITGGWPVPNGVGVRPRDRHDGNGG